MNEIAEDNKRKPKLTVEEQIEHLKSKGVTFELCDEGEASRILSEQDHYFRLAAYRVLFPKRVGGKHDGEYAELDFGQLVDLAGIDQELRRFLLPLTLDVENAAKTKLVEKITDNRNEDGYSVLAVFYQKSYRVLLPKAAERGSARKSAVSMPTAFQGPGRQLRYRSEWSSR